MDLLAGTLFGDRTDERRSKGKPGIRRVVAAGPKRLRGLALAGELQRDWARTETLQEFAQILFDHAGCSSSVLAWEMQPLGASDGEQMPAKAKLRGSCKEKG